MAITFQNQKFKFDLKQKTKIRSWINKIILSEKKEPGEINFVFTSDKELLKINIQYLNHHTLTDIITFDYCEGNIIHGDIFISIERVEENSEKFETTFDNELYRVMIHGVLHLCGYKDKTKKDVGLMRKKENHALKIFR
jgi:probable rRNA maturation factor